MGLHQISIDPADFGNQREAPQLLADGGSDGPCRDDAAKDFQEGTVTGNELGDETRQAYIDAGLPEEQAQQMHWAASRNYGAADVPGACVGQVGEGYSTLAYANVDAGATVLSLIVTTSDREKPLVDTTKPLFSAFNGTKRLDVNVMFTDEEVETGPTGARTYTWRTTIPTAQLGDLDSLVLRTDTGFLPTRFNIFTFYNAAYRRV